VSERLGRDVSLGEVYGALSALEDAGKIRGYDGKPLPERGNRSRRYYLLS